MSFRRAADALTTFAILVTCVVLVWVNWPKLKPTRALPVPARPVSIVGLPKLGSDSASVVVIEFSDFECPYCGVFARDVMPELNRKYVDSGKVQFAFQNFPLSRIHPHSIAAAQASLCAEQQHRFWPFHDQLFQHQKELSTEGLVSHASSAGLDALEFAACVTANATASALRHDIDAGSALGISGTPTFLIGTRQQGGSVQVQRTLTGARAEQFVSLLDELVGKTAR